VAVKRFAEAAEEAAAFNGVSLSDVKMDHPPSGQSTHAFSKSQKD